jgi:hypothetical protein
VTAFTLLDDVWRESKDVLNTTALLAVILWLTSATLFYLTEQVRKPTVYTVQYAILTSCSLAVWFSLHYYSVHSCSIHARMLLLLPAIIAPCEAQQCLRVAVANANVRRLVQHYISVHFYTLTPFLFVYM